MRAQYREWAGTGAVFLAIAPYIVLLSLILWRTPFPVSEAVAIFEDSVRRWPLTGFPLPEQAYYRPLFYIVLSIIWDTAGSIEQALAAVKLVQIIPVCVLLTLFVTHLRPRTSIDVAAAAVAAAVLIGSPGFADNVELPLSYTTVGMPAALAVWALMNREPRLWQGALVVLLTVVAIGYKEQGLVVVPIVVVAWWTGARGATTRLMLIVVSLALAYLAIRLRWRGAWAPFEQAIGLGFREIEPDEAIRRFGAFPYWVYAYSGIATIANVLFAEPSRGVFHIVGAILAGRPQVTQMIQLVSSTVLTALIAWWGIRAIRNADRTWSYEGRLFLALIAALVACGVLSFNYSRARLGGMAVPFYAMAAYFALRAAATQVTTARSWRFAVGVATLVVLATAWHSRAVGTIEYMRVTALRNHREWLTQLAQRRVEFADRPVYLRIMEAMVEQGLRQDTPNPTRFPLSVPIAQPFP